MNRPFRSRMLLCFSLLLLVVALAACQTSPTGTPPDPAKVLYQEDFSKTDNGAWMLMDDDTAKLEFTNQAYRFQVFQTDGFFWSRSGHYFTDSLVQVEVSKRAGPDTTEFGLICRYISDTAFYFMLVDSDGYYGIGEMDNGAMSLLGQAEMQQDNSSVIKTGNAVNVLQASCIGSRLALIVNGVELLAVEDDSLPAGDAGLVVGTYDPAGTDLLFDNFYVLKP